MIDSVRVSLNLEEKDILMQVLKSGISGVHGEVVDTDGGWELIATVDSALLLQEALMDLMQDTGFDKHDSPTSKGLVIEELIDKLIENLG